MNRSGAASQFSTNLRPLFLIRDRDLGVGALNLGDVHLLPGGVHQEVGIVDHAQLERDLFELFHGVVVELLGPFADGSGGVVDPVGQGVADSLAVDDLLDQIIEPVRPGLREIGQVFIGQNPGLVQLHGKGQHLGGGEAVQAVLLGHGQDVVVELQLLESGPWRRSAWSSTFENRGSCQEP